MHAPQTFNFVSENLGLTIYPGKWVCGTPVVLHGLHSDAGRLLNGEHALIEYWDQDLGRYALALDTSEDDQLYEIQPANLRVMDDSRLSLGGVG